MAPVDDELRYVDAELDAARHRLVSVMAAQRRSRARLQVLQGQVHEYTGYASAARTQGNAPLAREVAEHVARVERDVRAERAALDTHNASADRLGSAVQRTEAALERLRRRLRRMPAQQPRLDGKPAAAATPRTDTPLDLPTRRREAAALHAQVQAICASLEVDDVTTAGGLRDSDLDARLRAAGITTAGVAVAAPSAEAVLARLRARAQSNAS